MLLFDFAARPEPQVTWYVNGALIDSTYYVNGYGDVVNEVTFRQVNRSHLNSQFTCKASNTRLIPPEEKSVTLDLNRESSYYLSTVISLTLSQHGRS